MNQQGFFCGLAGLKTFSRERGCVATIGSFDGVHIGHQAILEQLRRAAARFHLPAVVIVFEPQPHEYFSKAQAAPRLMRLRDKVSALLTHGVDSVFCLRFNRRLSEYSAQQFVEEILVSGLGVKHLEVGDDFRFGCDRKGDFDFLKRMGDECGFTVTQAATYEIEGERVSSTRIRELLEDDNFERAQVLLGKPYQIRGRVVFGRQLGRQLGVATANIGLGRYRCPVNGVYAVRVTRATGEKKFGVANIGTRPTVSSPENKSRVHPLLEVHLFDFSQDIYGEYLNVELKKKIRDERKFSSIEMLKEQILFDIEHARDFFGRQINC